MTSCAPSIAAVLVAAAAIVSQVEYCDGWDLKKKVCWEGLLDTRREITAGGYRLKRPDLTRSIEDDGSSSHQGSVAPLPSNTLLPHDSRRLTVGQM